jgi:hypothetical protein
MAIVYGLKMAVVTPARLSMLHLKAGSIERGKKPPGYAT